MQRSLASARDGNVSSITRANISFALARLYFHHMHCTFEDVFRLWLLRSDNAKAANSNRLDL